MNRKGLTLQRTVLKEIGRLSHRFLNWNLLQAGNDRKATATGKNSSCTTLPTGKNSSWLQKALSRLYRPAAAATAPGPVNLAASRGGCFSMHTRQRLALAVRPGGGWCRRRSTVYTGPVISNRLLLRVTLAGGDLPLEHCCRTRYEARWLLESYNGEARLALLLDRRGRAERLDPGTPVRATAGGQGNLFEGAQYDTAAGD